MSEVLIWNFLIIFLVLDIIIILILIGFYFKFKKVYELPWEEIKESIEKAQELVSKLKEIEKEKKFLERGEKTDLKERVFFLAKQGLTSKDIAKKLKITEAEVELILASKK